MDLNYPVLNKLFPYFQIIVYPIDTISRVRPTVNVNIKKSRVQSSKLDFVKFESNTHPINSNIGIVKHFLSKGFTRDFEHKNLTKVLPSYKISFK